MKLTTTCFFCTAISYSEGQDADEYIRSFPNVLSFMRNSHMWLISQDTDRNGTIGFQGRFSSDGFLDSQAHEMIILTDPYRVLRPVEVYRGLASSVSPF